jgi:hypothetical protein
VKTLLASVAAVVVVVSLAGCSISSGTNYFDASTLEGEWTGDNLGYENGVYQDREIRLVFEQSTDNTFAGMKSWREHGGEWSEPEPFSGVIFNDQEFRAVDSDGYMIGEIYSSTSIDATYLEAGENNAAFTLALEKTAP